MKIIVLDGYTLNPGDLSWDALNELGEVTVYDRTSPDQVVSRAAGAEIILTNKTIVDGDTLRSLPALRYAGVLATGYNVINTEAARQLGIVVTNVPAYSTDSVAQLTFALILELCHHVQRHSDSVIKGNWSSSEDFSFRDYPLIELASKRIGIIGYGTIGKRVSNIAEAFGMDVLVFTRPGAPDEDRKITFTSLDDLLTLSDIVTIHCPLTPETAGLISLERLRKMKRSAFLINTSRGPVVAEKDLAHALNEGIIAGAGLDVLSSEPPDKNNPLLTARNCIITPHIAWATFESRTRLMDIAVNNIRSFISGVPVNVVN